MSELQETVKEIQKMMSKDPEMALGTVEVDTALKAKFECTSEMGEFNMVVDEPETFGGTNHGPNPLSVLLTAIATCQEITYRTHASLMDIPLRSVRIHAEGDIDVRGYLAVDKSVRPGFSEIRLSAEIDSDASDEELKKLQEAVNNYCPILDQVRNASSIKVKNVRMSIL